MLEKAAIKDILEKWGMMPAAERQTVAHLVSDHSVEPVRDASLAAPPEAVLLTFIEPIAPLLPSGEAPTEKAARSRHEHKVRSSSCPRLAISRTAPISSSGASSAPTATLLVAHTCLLDQRPERNRLARRAR